MFSAMKVTEKVTLTTDPMLNLLIMLLLLIRDLFSFLKTRQLLWSYGVVTNSEPLQIETTDSTKKHEKPGAVPHKISHGRKFYENWPDNI